MRASSSRGFTLIELLVVIAIIAILAANMFPVFSRAREKARAASCLSNLKQMGAAFQMYADDHESLLPAAWEYPNADPGDPTAVPPIPPQAAEGPPGLVEAILPYTKNVQMFVCPSDKLKRYLVQKTSYSYTADFFGSMGFPAELMCIDHPGDKDPNRADPSRFELVWDYSPSWHINGFNILYADGHAKQKVTK